MSRSLALHAARLAVPTRALNSTSTSTEYSTAAHGPKASALKDLKAAGVVDVQAWPLADVKRDLTLAEFVGLGVEVSVAITELDVRFMGLPLDGEGLEQQ
ncbi:hypothetical protein GSI_11181 [Ganoderma sinense ZZ0214-1]|uniref:Uncharacterized protein n=1 Tax=Ganoderma sinense ZZ0214-1 TaxID=1077348 RepID=A0A2G8RZ39_9APHY|nr:hypothetical protein GSI_11181 [Ganoderma sinense ZZ0214-1]